MNHLFVIVFALISTLRMANASDIEDFRFQLEQFSREKMPCEITFYSTGITRKYHEAELALVGSDSERYMLSFELPTSGRSKEKYFFDVYLDSVGKLEVKTENKQTKFRYHNEYGYTNSLHLTLDGRFSEKEVSLIIFDAQHNLDLSCRRTI